jgi:hypothetical protein
MVRVWQGDRLGPGRGNLFHDAAPQRALDGKDYPVSTAIDSALAGDHAPTVRPTAPDPRPGLACGCGCGQTLTAGKPEKRYVNGSHRRRASRARAAEQAESSSS